MSTYTHSIWRPGPKSKQNGGVNTVKGVVCHSMVGTFAAAMGELDNPARRASWHYSVCQSGKVYAHYTDETQCWHAGSAWNNDTIGIEHEGGFDPYDEPLTDVQRMASVELVRWLSARHGFPLVRGVGLFEHHEVSGAPTACPSGRIPWQYYIAPVTPPAVEEEDMPKVVWNTDKKAVFLVGFVQPILIGDGGEVASLEKAYGPQIALSDATMKQMTT